MKTLYLECFSGISGDMTVASLLDLGADRKKLCEALDSLGVEGYHLHFSRVVKCGISAFDFDVHLEHGESTPAEGIGHTHHHGGETDCGHSHGEGHGHEHAHGESHEHTHDHDHGGMHTHTHAHVHRNLSDVTEIIERGELTPRAKALAKAIFGRVARAEAKVHGKPLDEVHFHEVGAVDSIIDIVATAFCIDNLDIGKIVCSPLFEGRGTVQCAHGLMPVPAPATAEIAAEGGLSLFITEQFGEMVTPTGAAIAAELSGGEGPRGAFRILKTGYGAGKKEFARANVLRAHLIEMECAPKKEETVCELSCNLDNMTGEHLGFAMERLFEAGARDVWFTPIQMKKNRPGTLLSVLCMPEDAAVITECILRHTGTLGVRRQTMARTVMQREEGRVSTPYGDVEVKRAVLGELKKVSAEYESARRTAIAGGEPIKKIYHFAERE